MDLEELDDFSDFPDVLPPYNTSRQCGFIIGWMASAKCSAGDDDTSPPILVDSGEMEQRIHDLNEMVRLYDLLESHQVESQMDSLDEDLTLAWEATCEALAAVHRGRIVAPGVLESRAVADALKHNFFETLVNFNRPPTLKTLRFLVLKYEVSAAVKRGVGAGIQEMTDVYGGLAEKEYATFFRRTALVLLGPPSVLTQCAVAPRLVTKSSLRRLPRELIRLTIEFLVPRGD